MAAEPHVDQLVTLLVSAVSHVDALVEDGADEAYGFAAGRLTGLAEALEAVTGTPAAVHVDRVRSGIARRAVGA